MTVVHHRPDDSGPPFRVHDPSGRAGETDTLLVDPLRTPRWSGSPLEVGRVGTKKERRVEA